MLWIELIVSLFQSFLNVDFILKFNNSSWKNNKSAVITTIAIFSVTVIGDVYLPGFSTVISVAILSISIAYAMIICNRHYITAVLSACIYEAVVLLLSSCSYVVLSMVLSDYERLMQGENNLARYIYLIIANLLLFAVLRLLLHLFAFKDSNDIMTGGIAFILTMVTLIGLGTAMSLTEINFIDAIKLQTIIITCSYVIINIILYFLIYQIHKLQKIRYEAQLLNDKLKFEEERYNDATLIWNNVRKVQHDIKHHLIVVSGQLSDGDIDGCKTYINDLLQNTEHMGKLINSENTILDYLINSKLYSLKNTQIVISGSIGDLSDIREVDLSSIIGNILDNAVEAVSKAKDKRIELLFSMQNSNRIIVCRNTVASPVLSANSNLKSTKSDGESHGFGHVIVEKIVESYDGMIDYFEENNVFEVQIVLPKKTAHINNTQ